MESVLLQKLYKILNTSNKYLKDKMVQTYTDNHIKHVSNKVAQKKYKINNDKFHIH